MMYKTHLVFGLFIGFLCLSIFDVSNKYLFLILVCVASLFPDIDSKDSYIGKKLRPLSTGIEKTFGHRGFFHSLFPLLVIYLVLCLFGWKLIALGIAVGYLSHLISDAFTVTGVNFLYPLTGKISGFIKTGGLLEYILFLIFLVVDVFRIWGLFF